MLEDSDQHHAPPDSVADPEVVRDAVVGWKQSGVSVGFVPTMGALHEGHLSLVDASRQECDRTVVSIYVNPRQFNDPEDLSRYPRAFERDLELLAKRNCDLVFLPVDETMYAADHETYVEVGSIAEMLEGEGRPGHFRGVATVVLKLLHIVPANRAYFGRKDYQQTLVVRQMVRDLNLPVEISTCPTIRESNGLAMSSRNRALSAEEREQASALWASLQLGRSLVDAGETSSARVLDQMRARIAEARGVRLEYVAIVAEGTVDPLDVIDRPAVALIAAHVGETRMIDNLQIA